MPPKSWAWVYCVWHLRARGRLVSFLRKAFDSLLFLRPPGVCLRSPDHTSRQGCLFHVTILLPFILKKQVDSTHPFSNRTEGLATFLLKPTTASNDEWLLSKNLVPVRRGGPKECRSLCDFAHSSQPIAPFFLGCDQEAARRPDAQQLHAQPHFPSWEPSVADSGQRQVIQPRGQQLNEFFLLQTPLIANPVRPSHKARTIALRVARTCPSSSRRSGKRAIFSALCSSFSQQRVSIPTANRNSFSAAVKSFRRCLGPWGCILSVHLIPQHSLNRSLGMRKKTSNSWALLVSPMW